MVAVGDTAGDHWTEGVPTKHGMLLIACYILQRSHNCIPQCGHTTDVNLTHC